MRPVLRRLAPWAGAALGLAAVAYLVHALLRHPPGEVWGALVATPPARLGASVALCALAYLLLVGYDALGWRHAGRRVPWRRVGAASFVGYAMSHTMGASLVSGVAARHRFVRGEAALREVVGVVAFCALTSFLGYLALAGGLLALRPEALPVRPWQAASLAAAALGLVLAYLGASLARFPSVRVARLEVSFPAPGIAAGQVALGVAEWLVSAAALLVLLPQVPPLVALEAFVFGKLVGFLVHVPGGLGVFEAAVVAAVAAPVPGVVAALVAYRALYYLVPFALAAGLLLAHEARTLRLQGQVPAPR